MRNIRFLLLPAAGVLLACLAAAAMPVLQQDRPEKSHTSKGKKYFSEAFDRLLPRGQKREADAYFDLAAKEFHDAIAANSDYAPAHRNLARLYYVRKQFALAADSYRTVTILAPGDIDAYVLLALSYTQVDRFEDAIRTLETAKTKTENPDVLAKLDGYIRKLRNR